jgi:signal transduction histidine kinase
MRDLGEASERTERLIRGAFALVRMAALGQGALSVLGSWGDYRYPVAVFGAFAVVLVDSAVVVAVWVRRPAVRADALIVIDLASTALALILVDLATKPFEDPALANVLYPYSVASMVIVGFAPVRFRWAAAAASAMTVIYLAVTAGWLGFRTDLLENAVTYWAYAVGAWILVRRVRQLARSLDQARQQAVARELELAEERARAQRDRERAATFRGLHDHVLQTMEFLSRNRSVGDERVQNDIDRQAAWLRTLIRDQLNPDPTGLVAAIEKVVCEHAEAGLDTDLNVAGAKGGPVPAAVVAALSGAVHEALTNIRKHAGPTPCVVRVTATGTRVTVTVLDRGMGFEPEWVQHGTGLRQSIVARMAEIGGGAQISSSPGAGTLVELDVRLTPELSAARRDG